MSRTGLRVLSHLLATTSLCALGSFGAFAQQAVAPDATLRLPPITAEGDRSDEAFQTPAATSTVTRDQLREGGDTNRLLETVPGIAAGGYDSQPGVAVNIRGMEGVGRVNMMVEGVRQNFRPAGHEGGSFAYVDPNFLSGIDVDRGAVTGPAGMGALVGAVNFRLLDVSDILRPGQNFGGRLQGSTGTNGYQWNSSLVSAARLANGVSVLAGASGRQNSNYKNGDGDIVDNTEQSLRSGIARVNWDPTPEHHLSLLANVYTNRFTSNFYDQTMQSNLTRLSYRYNPASPLIDLRTSASWNQVRMNNYLTEAGNFSSTASGRRIVNTAYQADVANTSRFDFGSVNLAWEYGLQYATDDTETRKGGVNGDGRLNLAGTYSNAVFTRGIFSFTQGLRYDHFSLDGEGFAAPAIGPVPVTGDYRADTSEGKVSPRFTLAVQALDWLQPYASYGWAFRPPTISEAMYSGPHSAGGTSTFYPNPYLRPETSRGWELGANVLRRNTFTAGDRIRFKAAYFDNDVEDLINLVNIRGTSNGRSYSYNFYENVDGTSRLTGVELEGGYDMGIAYVNGSFTSSRVTYPDDAQHSYLPRTTMVLDGGVRLLDRTLTIGGRIRRVGETQSWSSSTGQTTPIPAFTTYDLYSSWKVTENLNLFANATNISDEVYTVPAAETVGGGRGRTIIGGLTLTF